MFSSIIKESVHIYLDETCLKAAKIAAISGKRLVTGLYYKDITGVSDTSLPLDVKDALQALGVKNRTANLLLSSKFAITKTIEVPSLDEKEIRDIVKLQAVRHTPYSKEEVIVGHMNLDVVLERYTKSLLVIASNENVRKRTDAIEAAFADIHNVHLVMEVVAKAAVAALPASAEGCNFGVVYFDKTFTDILFINKSKPVYVRNVPIGAKQVKENYEQASKQLVDEFKKTLEAYQSEDTTASPKRFMMLGIDSADQKVLAKKLEDELQIKFDAGLPESRLHLSDEAKKQMAQFADVSFLDVIYDGLAETPFALDLIPADLVIKRAFQAKGREFFTGGVFLMILFILMMCTIGTKIYFRQSYLKNLRKDYENKQKDAQELGVLSEQIRLIKLFGEKKNRSLLILNELQKILPEDMYLSEITLTPDEKISIKGTSPLMSAVFAFVTLFENDPYFKTVTTDYTKSRKENDKDVSDFGLSAQFEEPATNGQ